jgi:hypothetical protein
VVAGLRRGHGLAVQRLGLGLLGEPVLGHVGGSGRGIRIPRGGQASKAMACFRGSSE